MIVADILKKQITLSYPNATKESEDELIGVDIEGCGRLHVNKKLQIHMEFDLPIHQDDNVIQLFFSPRVKARSEYMRLYFSRTKFQAECDFWELKEMWEFEAAMEYFLIFKSMYDSLVEFNSYK